MNCEQIYVWLGLPAGNWPPDHYTLLGLQRGEADVGRIEHHVHERLAKLRGYQLSSPDQATEAMNRLAQAFMCLTDPEAKKAYDRISGCLTAEVANQAQTADDKNEGGTNISALSEAVRKKAAESTNLKKVVSDDTSTGKKTQVDWKSAPPPVRLPTAEPVSGAIPCGESLQNGQTSTSAATAQPGPLISALPVSQPIDAHYEAAHASPEARRGIGTARALIDRVYQTRDLLLAWERIGKHLKKTQKQLTRLGEQNDLALRLEEISAVMESFPKLLGQPGQPGYRVLAMARLKMTPLMFNMLDPPQREALARDWLAGRVVLMTHRHFLLQELKKLKQQNLLTRALRMVRAILNDHPAWVLLVLSLIGVGLFVYFGAFLNW